MASARDFSVHYRHQWDVWASLENLDLIDSDDEENPQVPTVLQRSESDTTRLKRIDIPSYGRYPSWDDFVICVCCICKLVMKLQCLKSHIGRYHRNEYPFLAPGQPQESSSPHAAAGHYLEFGDHANDSNLSTLPPQNSPGYSDQSCRTGLHSTKHDITSTVPVSRYTFSHCIQTSVEPSNGSPVPSTSNYVPHDSSSFTSHSTHCLNSCLKSAGHKRKQENREVKRVRRMSLVRNSESSSCSLDSESGCQISQSSSSEGYQPMFLGGQNSHEELHSTEEPINLTLNMEQKMSKPVSRPVIHNITSAAIVATTAASISAVETVMVTPSNESTSTFQSFRTTASAVSVITSSSSAGSHPDIQQDVDIPQLKYATALLPDSSSSTSALSEIDFHDRTVQAQLLTVSGELDDLPLPETKPTDRECMICSEVPGTVLFEPCGHRVACEDCCLRMKKCIVCQEVIVKKTAAGGKVISSKLCQASIERMRYLESKIQEIEEAHCCSICVEERRNVAFMCGHGACITCAERLENCHMCRKPITKKINLY